MNEKIADFISRQTVVSICCINSVGHPYSFSCFFAYDPSGNFLYFKSSASTHHSKLISENPIISGTILPDKFNRLAIKGIQLTGVVLAATDTLARSASAVYHKKYPFALAVPGEMWTVRIDTVKMTDNTVGFGTKLLWQRDKKTSIDLES